MTSSLHLARFTSHIPLTLRSRPLEWMINHIPASSILLHCPARRCQDSASHSPQVPLRCTALEADCTNPPANVQNHLQHGHDEVDHLIGILPLHRTTLLLDFYPSSRLARVWQTMCLNTPTDIALGIASCMRESLPAVMTYHHCFKRCSGLALTV